LSVSVNDNYSVNFSIFVNELCKAGVKDIFISEPHFLAADKKIVHMSNEESMSYIEDLKIMAFTGLMPEDKRVIFDDDVMGLDGKKIIKNKGEKNDNRR
jgi:hypothetical protein